MGSRGLVGKYKRQGILLDTGWNIRGKGIMFKRLMKSISVSISAFGMLFILLYDMKLLMDYNYILFVILVVGLCFMVVVCFYKFVFKE